jgi:5,10-methylenetetrahydromethanopterin reductase
MIGATGDQMMELAGEIADGVVLNYCSPPEQNDHPLELLDKGARKSGRSLDDIDRPQLIVCSVDEDHDIAIDSARGLLTQYLAQQPHIAKSSGVSEDIVREIQAILGWPATQEQIDQAKHLVPDEFVDRVTASGTPDEARCCVNEYRKRGCTCPILYPVCGDVKLLVDTFAQG